MGQSYRIKTELGVNKTINVSFEQDFEFLEILSLQIQQTEVYNRSCAEYGVVVGRVTANNGFGIPNARVSVFIPISNIDESNPIISSIYPYKSPEDKNEDGYRYNLLPYEKSYSAHAATGTLPTRLDALTDPTVVEIYDKYYRLTAKTNESGDYMIMGVPIGARTLVMDVDLSDIGEFSLTPQDLIRMGLATESQVAGNRFRTSNDLNSLPQIINLRKDIEVLPLWGDPSVCQLAITRTDFDLRNDANIDIQPTAVFMGSIYSSPEKYRVRPAIRVAGLTVGGCKPKDNLGNLCNLVSGPGQILAIRQTIQQDSDGNPILETYQLEQSGNIIDGDGTWLTEVPMNLDYLITNEFGEKVVSNDPTIGIPTKGKYRFKIKWQQPPTLTEQTRRAYFLVPNIKEYGWTNSTIDPNYLSENTFENKRLSSSYYFGLDWSGYTEGFIGQQKIDKLNESINCEDTFYEFQYNRVYTVSGFIDQWKKGGTGRFIGIKEIDNDDCSSTINKFPVNDGFRNFDFLFFLFSILFTVIQPVLLIFIAFANIVLGILNIIIGALCSIIELSIGGARPFWFLRGIIPCNKWSFSFNLPMITYPDCSACQCEQNVISGPADIPGGNTVQAGGVLSYFSLPSSYFTGFQIVFSNEKYSNELSTIYSESISGLAARGVLGYAYNSENVVVPIFGNVPENKLPLSTDLEIGNESNHVSSKELTIGERINVFNSRKNYFDGINKIKVKIEPTLNIGSDKYHYDNTIVVICNNSFNSGDLLTTINLNKSTDINWLWSATTASGVVNGISGTSYTTTGQTPITITYASTPTTSQTITYQLPFGNNVTNYQYPADIEYFQVITAVTWSEISNYWNPLTLESFPNILSADTTMSRWQERASNYRCIDVRSFKAIDLFANLENQYVVILQRGVDPYSPKYTQRYEIGNLFGTNESDPKFVFTAQTRLNIPIQINSSASISVQEYTQNQMFFNSYFFKPGIVGSNNSGESFSAFTTVNTGYYGLLDSSRSNPTFLQNIGNQVLSSTSNGFYNALPSGSKYDLSEDLSGGSAMGCNNFQDQVNRTHTRNNYSSYFGYQYYSKTIYENVSWSAMTISDSSKNILRTDRLPSSDQLDGNSWGQGAALLQQNLNFNFYFVITNEGVISSQPLATGAQQPEIDIVGLPNSGRVIESFNCEKMVSLDCYEGFGTNFKINEECANKNAVKNGCYTFLKNPPFSLGGDFKLINEWAFRFRFFYGICRGVLSQSFVNNWVNGSLYAFPIQVDTIYDSQNKPSSNFCKDLIYFDTKTNNFYYRSSPWSGRFIGKAPLLSSNSLNKTNLLFPTTIMNLGMKDSYFNELTYDASTRAYVMTELDSTSYGDTSDLVNLFVISRITDESFLQQLLSQFIGNNSLNQLFSRPELRIDGDLAQLMSINSELGLIKFSQEYYEYDSSKPYNPVIIGGTPKKPIIGVWYSSTTENLQTKDYLTPGRINFRATPSSNFIPYSYGIKSQVVPFYRWQLKNGDTIFGTQDNNWSTDQNSIVQNKRYQSLDRTEHPYFKSTTSPITNDLYARGYIFSVDQNGNYSLKSTNYFQFVVGAPFHFYFGIQKGNSALDKFKIKYSILE